MSAELADYHRALRVVQATALRAVSLDMQIDGERASVPKCLAAEHAVLVAARSLTRAVEALPDERKRQIKGWMEVTQ